MKSKINHLIMAMLCLSILACNTGPEPIQFGKDQCAFCKMTIMDRKFGSELVTEKGRIFKFDDVNCLVHYMDEQNMLTDTKASHYVIDYNNPGVLIDAGTAIYLHSDQIKSPMAGRTAAISDSKAAATFKAQWDAESWNWKEVVNYFVEN
jgi:copper chaperone NosL